MLTIIVAVAENGVIGSENRLLWHIREDMVHFRTTTSNHIVAMGRKTFESIGRPLPKRRNIVITRQPIAIEGCEVVHSLEEVLKIAADTEVFIIGGSQIYEQAMPYADRLCLTTVHRAYEGDASFPSWKRDEWELVSSTRYERGEEFEYPFSIEEYRRK